jgi:hypothetical protein
VLHLNRIKEKKTMAVFASVNRIIKKLGERNSGASVRRRPRSRQLRLEALEERLCMSSPTVSLFSNDPQFASLNQIASGQGYRSHGFLRIGGQP